MSISKSFEDTDHHAQREFHYPALYTAAAIAKIEKVFFGSWLTTGHLLSHTVWVTGFSGGVLGSH